MKKELLELNQQAQIHKENEAWDPYVETLLKSIELFEKEDEQIKTLREIARTYCDRLSDPEKALVHFEKILDLDINDNEAAESVSNHYRKNELWEDLIGLLLDQLDAVDKNDIPLREQLYLEIAQLYAEKLSQPECGYLLMIQALTAGSDLPEVYIAVQKYAEDSDKNEALNLFLRELVRERTQNGDDSALQLLDFFANFLVKTDDLDMAAMYYGRIIKIDPEHEKAFSLLAKIYEQDLEWEALVELLTNHLEFIFDYDERLKIMHQIAAINSDKMHNQATTITAYQAILQLHSEDPLAQKTLTQIYKENGDLSELADLLEDQLLNAQEDEETISLLLQLGSLSKQLEDTRRAIDAYSEVIAIVPEHEEALKEMEKLFLHLEKWDDYLSLIDHQLSFLPENEAPRLFKAKALVLDQALNEQHDAAECYQLALEADPTDQESLLHLQEIYTEIDESEKFISITQQLIELVEKDDEKTTHLLRLGKALFELDELEESIQAFQKIVVFSPLQKEANKQLIMLFTQLEDWKALISLKKRVANALENAPIEEQLDAWLELALLCEKQCTDPIDALEAAANVLKIDRENLKGRAATQRLLEKAKQWKPLVQFLDSELSFSQNIEQRATLIAKQGEIYEIHLKNPEKTQEKYEKATELAPNIYPALRFLTKIYLKQEQWARARPRLVSLLEHARAEDDLSGIYKLTKQLGLACGKLFLHAKAANYYTVALTIKPSDKEVLYNAAHFTFMAKKFEDALKFYQKIIEKFADDLPTNELIDMHHKAAACHYELEQTEKQRQCYRSALEVDSFHEKTLRALHQLTEGKEELDDNNIERLCDLLTITLEKEERFKLLVEIGDGLVKKEKFQLAAENYDLALQIEPDSKMVLQRLLTLFSTIEEWIFASEILGKLAELEKDTKKRAHLLFTIGALYRDQLHAPVDAIPFYDAVLLIDINRTDAFEAIELILQEQKDWSRLEKAYRKMLERFQKAEKVDPQLHFAMFFNLGEIYRLQFNKPNDAIIAYQFALQIMPDNTKTQIVLATMLEKNKREQEAIELHQAILKKDPKRLKSYQKLLKIYKKHKLFDQAWCVASVLVTIGHSNQDQEDFFIRYRAKEIIKTKFVFTQKEWKLLNTHSLDKELTAIFSTAAIDGKNILVRELKDWGLHKRKDRAEKKAPKITTLITFLSNLLSIKQPLLYARQANQGIQNAQLSPRALLLGGDMLMERLDLSTVFATTKALVLLQNDFYIASAYPSSAKLKMILNAIILLTTQKMIADPSKEEVITLATKLQVLPPNSLIQMQNRIMALFNAKKNPDVSRWLREVEKTANRVAFLLCNDLQSAIDALNKETFSISKLPIEEKISDLLLFSISDEYHKLRELLSITIQSR